MRLYLCVCVGFRGLCIFGWHLGTSSENGCCIGSEGICVISIRWIFGSECICESIQNNPISTSLNQ